MPTMSAPVAVEDAVSVVVHEQKTTPGDELTMALQMEVDRPRSRLLAEEKKDDSDAPPVTRMKADEEPVEEGQEALWVEDTKDQAPALDTENASPPKSPRRWMVSSPRRSSTAAAAAINNRVFLPPKDPPKKPSPLETTVQVGNKEEIKKLRTAAQKVETARKLLNQALSPHANVGSRDLLAQAAFSHATEARRLVTPNNTLSPELETLLKDATAKGQAEVSMMRELQLQQVNTGSSDTNTNTTQDMSEDERKSCKSSTSGDEHASRARNLLEFILPDVDISNLPPCASGRAHGDADGPHASPDDVSTLGFDNTYVGKGGSKDFDILSMSSLNEILDGPLDEDPTYPVIKHRLGGKKQEQEEDAQLVTKAEGKDKSAPKRSSLFGSDKKKKKAAAAAALVAAAAATAAAAAATGEAKPQKEQVDAKVSSAEKNAAVSAALIVGDVKKQEEDEAEAKENTAEVGVLKSIGGLSENEAEVAETKAKEETKAKVKTVAKRASLFGSMFRSKSKAATQPLATAPNGVIKTPPRKRWGAKETPEEKQVAEVDSPRRFVTTVIYDEGCTQSNGIDDVGHEISNIPDLGRIRSIDERVNMLLKEAMDNDDTESLTSSLGVPIHGKEEKPKQNDSKEKKTKKKEGQVVKDEPVEEVKRSARPRRFEDTKPTFVAAPKGDAAILTAKSYESLELEDHAHLPAITRSHSDESLGGVESQDGTPTTVEDLPTTPADSIDSSGDRYAVAADKDVVDDRYKVPDEESFEAFFWDPCSPKHLTIVQAADTCSTLGMAAASCLQPLLDAVDPRKTLDRIDKYALAPIDPDQETLTLAQSEADDSTLPEESVIEPNVLTSAANEVKTEVPKEVTTEVLKEVTTEMAKDVSDKETAQPTVDQKSHTTTRKKRLKIPGVVSGLFGKQRESTATPSQSKGASQSVASSSKVSQTKAKRVTPTKPKSRRQKQEQELIDIPEQRPEEKSRITVVTTYEEPSKETSNDTVAEPVLKDTVDTEEQAELSDPEPEFSDKVDPLVAQIKSQSLHSFNRGLDPAAVNESSRRGIDP